MSNLTFKVLREANMRRLPQFRNKKGQLAHSKADGSDWTPAQWLQAVIGELGEYANFRKKFERGDIDDLEFARHAAKELADVATYLDILARRCLDIVEAGGMVSMTHNTGVDLGAAVVEKFNEISVRAKSTVRISEKGLFWYYQDETGAHDEAGHRVIP